MRRWWALVVLIWCTACAKHSEATRLTYEEDGRAGLAAESSPSYGGGASVPTEDMAYRAKAKPDRRAPPLIADAIPPMSPEPVPADSAQGGPAPAVTRMVHYDGWARLRVANPRDTLEAIVAVAERAGGRTEQMAGNTVTVRIPVDTFEAIWTEILKLGDVMDRSVRADDVTEQFTAVDLRVRTLRTTRARLVELLAKSRNEDERLRLLAELTRVTEDLDAFESQLRTLADLAAMSRITVEAVPREAFSSAGGRPQLDGFAWAAALSPFRRGVWEDDHRIALPTPDGLVMLSPKGPYMAESADGTVLWTMRVPNDPVGTGEFWIDALADRLADEFAAPTRETLGNWSCLTLDQPAADEPYRWQTCIRPAGRHLDVAQVYFPGPAQVERYGEVIDRVFGGGGGGA